MHEQRLHGFPKTIALPKNIQCEQAEKKDKKNADNARRPEKNRLV